MAPLLAAKARREKGVGLMVVPTKALVEQTAAKAQEFGIHALAISEDTVQLARLEVPRRDLFAELFAGKDVCLGIMSPQMLRGSRMEQILRTPSSRNLVRWFLIDEADLAHDKDGPFGAPYTALAPVRHMLSPKTVWVAVTGSATPSDSRSLAKLYGFHSGSYVHACYSLDRPNIKYTTRFLQHAHTTDSFLDLSFVIPFGIQTVEDIIPTLIFARTIKEGYALMSFLDSLLPISLPNRFEIIKLYNSLMPQEYRIEFRSDFENPARELRIGIVTDTLTFGFDIRVNRVIILDTAPLVKPPRLKQRVGRAGRDGSPSEVITYAPAWVQIPKAPVTSDSTKTEKENVKRRADLPLTTLKWYNPTEECCTRGADMEYFSPDHSFVCDKENPLCSFHAGDNNTHPDLLGVQKWDNHLKTVKPRGLRTDRTYRALDSRLQKSLIACLERWRVREWRDIRGDNIDDTCEMFFPDYILEHLVDRAHICSTIERFRHVLSGWEYLEKCGDQLFTFITQAMKDYLVTFWEGEESDPEPYDDDSEIRGEAGDRKDSASSDFVLPKPNFRLVFARGETVPLEKRLAMSDRRIFPSSSQYITDDEALQKRPPSPGNSPKKSKRVRLLVAKSQDKENSM
ncbi:hypothetical protein PQX77_011584 [Marasmius sp. AFHP31]|nr:hypothetical protein PQX77_011584 [Marasmius sp. AFHP31]